MYVLLTYKTRRQNIMNKIKVPKRCVVQLRGLQFSDLSVRRSVDTFLLTHSSLHFLIDCLGILDIGCIGTFSDRYSKWAMFAKAQRLSLTQQFFAMP